jgi:hypothetical protein
MNFYCSPLPSVLPKTLGLKTFTSKSGWHISLDEGWEITEQYAFKGIESNWCRINFGDNFSIDTNDLRDFPLYGHDACLTNIKNHIDEIPIDGTVSWSDGNMRISWDEGFFPIISNQEKLNFSQASDLIFETLCESVESFASKNKKELYVSSHGGTDTLAMRGVFDYLKIPYQLFGLHRTRTSYGALHDKLANTYWGFAQVKEIPNSVCVTGFNGDEWLLRNPYYVHILLSNRGIDITEQFESKADCYMRSHFDKQYKHKCSSKPDFTAHKVQTMMCNDYQIWHLNETYFFSGFKNKKLLGLLEADSDTMIKQVTDAVLTKDIIERLNPALLKYIDPVKNLHQPEYFWKA